MTGADEPIFLKSPARWPITDINCVVFREFGEFVTYDAAEHDPGTTNVIAILSGHQPNRSRS